MGQLARTCLTRACIAAALAETLISCSKQPTLLPESHVGGVVGAITTPDLLAGELQQCSRGTPAGDAKPAPINQADLEEFEVRLPRFVASLPPAHDNRRIGNLGSYHRRYSGLIRGAHRRMYVSFITSHLSGSPTDWRAPTF